VRRLLVLGLAAGLLGGAAVAFGARRPWESAQVLGVPTAPDAHASVAASLGAVILLGTVVVAVTGRRVAGAIVALAAAGVVVAVVAADTDWVGWRVAVLAGGVLGVASGALAAGLGHRWPTMSGRYDAPGSSRDREQDPWTSLDRGEDPTV
jgi:Tryptophan-associated transmembrane protein (Trp_oprn_chp)